MPITRLVNSALDGVAHQMEATMEEIVKFSGSDLICYRASEPQSLVEAQAAAWDPILALVHEKIGVRFICAEGILFVDQPAHSRASVQQTLQEISERSKAPPVVLASLNVMTTLTGSALIALAVAWGKLSTEEAWAAAHVDEDFQIGIWGADHEALQRRARRWKEMEAAARLFQLLRDERF
jgi:chaperone required for assembly of F1-ATPase